MTFILFESYIMSKEEMCKYTVGFSTKISANAYARFWVGNGWSVQRQTGLVELS